MNLQSSKVFSLDDFKKHFLAQAPIIDVRAEVEFQSGAIPGSVNFPILNDHERELVGTFYKQKGQDEAVRLGYELVSGLNKELKVKSWTNYIQQHPNALITCFRGGKRSQITQQFLKESGVDVPRIEKGYKQIRQFFIDELKIYSLQKQMILLTGCTGSAKTHLIQKVQAFYPSIDLEKIAQHRGSAFGAMAAQQPSQADFENRLSAEIIKIEAREELRPILFEDESRLIGRRNLTDEFFNRLRQSKVIVVKNSLQQRVDNIFLDYITNAKPGLSLFESFENSLLRIQKRLGGLKCSEILKDIQKSKEDFLSKKELDSNKIWIEKLLVHYYDPLYLSSFAKREAGVLFEGTHAEILDFLAFFQKFRTE
jgi:tRNA 2-selenouridine synthase